MDQEPSTKIEGWKQYFHDRGLAASDIPKALVVHEVFSCVSHALGLYSPAAGVVSKSRKSRCGRAIGLTWFATSWTVCYHLQPCKALGSRFFKERSEQFFAAAQRKLDRWAGAVNRVPGLRSADKTRLVISMAESSLVRNVARPIMIPLKIWLAYQAVALQASLRQKK